MTKIVTEVKELTLKVVLFLSKMVILGNHLYFKNAYIILVTV